ncbi:MAG: hypothetical protein LBE09_06370, partial [Christensenellaceae bacterium]|nr:hypothetical protein [Christensenellaceae bacterium]
MNGVFTLVKLDLKSKVGFSQRFNRKAISGTIVNIIFTLLIYAVYIVGLYLISSITITGSVPLRYEFLVVAAGIGMLIETLVCTAVFVKNLYYDGDNELLLRFPVDGRQIFMAKAITTYITSLTVALFFVYPMFVFYGIFTHATVSHFVNSLVILPLITLLPFFIACLIALPVINMTNSIKNRFALLLALMIIIVVIGFACYMFLLKGVLEYAQNKSPGLLTDDMRNQIRTITAQAFPFNLFANVLYNEFVWQSLLIILALVIAFGALAYWVSKKTVYPIVLKSIERESEAFEIKTEDKVRKPFTSLLRKEYLMIFRSLNYSFQYLSMAITAPVMVFFCNDLASSIGDTTVGGRVIPGLTLLVVVIFITIIVSFASTAISREGQTFYLTKIIPISYRYQILVKLIMYFVVATASTLVSCIIVWIAFGGEKYGNNVQMSDIFSIFAIAEMLIIALSCLAINSDLKSPSFEVSKSGELVEANKNASVNMLVGCILAVLYGIITMIFSYIPLKIGGVVVISDT